MLDKRFFPSFTPLFTRDIVVLTFHNISEYHYSWFGDLVFFLNHHYGFLDPSVLLSSAFNPNLSLSNGGPRLLISFDDGFYSSYHCTRSYLDPLGIKALFFPAYNFLLSKSLEDSTCFAQTFFFPARSLTSSDGCMRSMSLDDITSLYDSGHLIGAHTLNHPILSQCSQSEIQDEILLSKQYLEALLGSSVSTFAYPFGSFHSLDLDSVPFVRHYFNCAFTNIRGGLSSSPCRHLLFRQNISPGTSLFKIMLILNGLLNLRYFRQRSLLHSSIYDL
tara:strand:- start:450 stop:1277 length:828 start_codon:yes stop_codon:yes gene_type:complete